MGGFSHHKSHTQHIIIQILFKRTETNANKICDKLVYDGCTHKVFFYF